MVFPDCIKVMSLYGLVGCDLYEIVSCPVRALKAYLVLAKTILGPSRDMFCSVRNTFAYLSMIGFSGLIKSLIQDAHRSISQECLPLLQVKAHDVRAVVTSLAFIRNTPLHTVIDTAT